jgi:hypothetical protein
MQEGALEDQKAQDWNERGDQHRGEEDAESRLRLDGRKPNERGNTIDQKRRIGPAPSMRAASKSSCGELSR